MPRLRQLKAWLILADSGAKYSTVSPEGTAPRLRASESPEGADLEQNHPPFHGGVRSTVSPKGIAPRLRCSVAPKGAHCEQNHPPSHSGMYACVSKLTARV